MNRDVDNTKDIIDSRDIIARIEELQEERGALTGRFRLWKCDNGSFDVIDSDDETEEPGSTIVYQNVGADGDEASAWDAVYALENPSEAKELAILEALADECEGCGDWSHGETLIRETYFKDYAQELADDLGVDQSSMQWPYTCIDWDQATRELAMDYTSVDFDGVEYLLRS
jgi:hypothetical protein